jgi:acyl-CoA thioesterase-1
MAPLAITPPPPLPRGPLRILAASAVGLLLVIATSSACRREQTRAAAPESRPKVEAIAQRPTIVFLGTSLTAGFGLEPEEAYPALIQQRLDEAGLAWRVVNAGVSGETSAGALRRIDWLMQQPIGVLVIETGANDGLRGQDTEAMRRNIQALIDRARRAQPPPRLLLLGMQAPPNMGTDYARRFRDVYRGLAQDNGIPLVPFLLDGVGGIGSLNQADGIHPTAAGQKRLADTVWQALRPLL